MENTPLSHASSDQQADEPVFSTQEVRAQDDALLQDIARQTAQQKQQEHSAKTPALYPYTTIASIQAYTSEYQATVCFNLEGQDYEYEAMTTVALESSQLPVDCVLSFHQGRLDQPIITGIIQSEATDKRHLPLNLHSEVGISLQCGASRIELDENGTINIQGLHINSQAYGPHRIKGGSVKIN